MSESMENAELLSMFQPVAPEKGQAQSPSITGRDADNSSFLDCLLGACSGVQPAVGNEESLDVEPPLLLSSVTGELELIDRKNLLGVSLLEKSALENPEGATRKDQVQRIQDTQPVEGKEAEMTETMGKILDGLDEKNRDLSLDTLKAKDAKVVADRSTPLPETVDKARLGGSENDLATPSRILRFPKEGTPLPSDLALGKGLKSSLANVNEAGPSEGFRGAPGDKSVQTLQNLVFRSHTGQPEPSIGNEKGALKPDPSVPKVKQDGSIVFLTEEAVEEGLGRHPSVSEIHGTKKTSLSTGEGIKDVLLSDSPVAVATEKKGIQKVIPTQKEVIGSPTTPILPPGETAVTSARPGPISLADGVMQQILENLNVRTWRVGRKGLKIQLYPEELGRVGVEIGTKNHHVVLKIDVENPLVKDLIDNNLAQLREGLMDRGLRMDKCSVTVSDSFHYQSGGGQNGSTESAGRPFPNGSAETEEGDPQGPSSSHYQDSGLVNLFI